MPAGFPSDCRGLGWEVRSLDCGLGWRPQDPGLRGSIRGSLPLPAVWGGDLRTPGCGGRSGDPSEGPRRVATSLMDRGILDRAFDLGDRRDAFGVRTPPGETGPAAGGFADHDPRFSPVVNDRRARRAGDDRRVAGHDAGGDIADRANGHRAGKNRRARRARRRRRVVIMMLMAAQTAKGQTAGEEDSQSPFSLPGGPTGVAHDEPPCRDRDLVDPRDQRGSPAARDGPDSFPSVRDRTAVSSTGVRWARGRDARPGGMTEPAPTRPFGRRAEELYRIPPFRPTAIFPNVSSGGGTPETRPGTAAFLA
jgi:hypothetical protein